MFQPLKSQVGGLARNEVARSETLPAPVGGLNTRDAEATMKPVYATIMENFWPQERFLGIRKGWTAHMTGFAEPVKHLAAWHGTTGNKLFAITDDGIFDATTAGTVGSNLLTRTEGDHVSVNFSVSGGAYVFAVNATDDLARFDGTTWTAIPTFPILGGGGATIDTDKFSYVAVHQRALFFIEEDSMHFHYLPINQISGDLAMFPLGALFKRGGRLVAMGSWTVDGGVGLNDVAVFITSEGEAAVYRGTDPSTAANWVLDGVFDVGRPITSAPFAKLGADLLILTDLGVVSMTQVLRAGFATERTTYTDLISSKYRTYARNFGGLPGWRIIINPSLNMLLIDVPGDDSQPRRQLAMNIITKAWTEFTGLDTISWGVMGDTFYGGFGTTVGEFWTSTDDNGARIACLVKCAWLFLRPRGRRKKLSLIRFVSRVGGRIRLFGAVDADFKFGRDWQSLTNLNEPLARYDTDLWDTAVWGQLPEMQLDWLTISCEEGHCIAPRLRAFAGDATFEWSAIDYAYLEGGIQ